MSGDAVIALSSFPQNDKVRLGVVADVISDSEQDLKKGTLDVLGAEARPGDLTKQRLFRGFQRHLHSLAHYEERTGFFQKTMDRAVKKNIGLRLVDETGTNTYRDILDQVEGAYRDASNDVAAAKKVYLEGLSKLRIIEEGRLEEEEKESERQRKAREKEEKKAREERKREEAERKREEGERRREEGEREREEEQRKREEEEREREEEERKREERERRKRGEEERRKETEEIPEKDTVNKELKKWVDTISDDGTNHSWFKAAVEVFENGRKVLNDQMNTSDGSRTFKSGRRSITTDTAKLYTSGSPGVFGEETFDDQVSGHYTLVGHRGEASLLPIEVGGLTLEQSGLNEEFDKSVKTLFPSKEWVSPDKKTRPYEKPDVRVALLRSHPDYKPRGRVKYKATQDAYSNVARQTAYVISIRPYFGYAPVLVHINLSLDIVGQKLPIQLEGIFSFGYKVDEGNPPTIEAAKRHKVGDTEEPLWSTDRNYWNVEYPWGKTDKIEYDKPGHSVCIVLYESAFNGLKNAYKDDNHQVWLSLFRTVETFMYGLYPEASLETFPVMLNDSAPSSVGKSRKDISEDEPGAIPSFAHAFRLLQTPKPLKKGQDTHPENTVTKITISGHMLMVSAETKEGTDLLPYYRSFGDAAVNGDYASLVDAITSMSFDEPGLHSPSYLWVPFENITEQKDIDNLKTTYSSKLDDELIEAMQEGDKESLDNLKKKGMVAGDELHHSDEEEEWVSLIPSSETAADIVSRGLRLSGASSEMIEASKTVYPPPGLQTDEKSPISATSCME